MIDRTAAVEILDKNLKNKNLLKHCFAVEAVMITLAEYFNKKSQASHSKQLWGLIGLLHDGDWEATRNTPNLHTKKMVEWLKEKGETDTVLIHAILSHNHINNKEVSPENLMEWSLYTCDELTGFIIAVALIMPDKKLSSVTVPSVIKKFPSKSFAAAVNREQIKLCEEKLGIPLEEFVELVLKSMQLISTGLGL